VNCGQHCLTHDADGNPCVLKPHEGAHTFGALPCETKMRFRYRDQAAADAVPACGFAGVMTVAEVEAALAEMES